MSKERDDLKKALEKEKLERADSEHTFQASLIQSTKQLNALQQDVEDKDEQILEFHNQLEESERVIDSLHLDILNAEKSFADYKVSSIIRV